MHELARHLSVNCRMGIAKNGAWLWLVNPRTGLTSMRNVLDPHCRMSWRDASKPLWEAIAPKLLDVFMFTFVRNAWDRVLSAYCCLRDNQGRFGRLWRNRGGARVGRYFRAYVLEELKNDQNFLHFRPQLPTVACNGERIPNLFVGRFERLAEDWRIVADRLGIRKDLPHFHKTEHKPYWEHYDHDSRQVVAELYAEEIAVLGYEFGG